MPRWIPLLVACACSPAPAPPDAGTPTRITTLAGANGAAGAWADGTATEARFNMPEGLVLDPGGGLVVADTANHALRRVDLATGAVTTLAGVPSEPGFADSDADGGARLFLPRNLALAPGGAAVYFTDTGNSVIRRFDFVTRAVTTEFGRDGGFGRKSFFGVQAWGGGLVLDPDAGRLYVADSANQTIRAIDLATREVTTVAGTLGVEGAADGPAHSATFNKPSGLVLHGRALYITEANNLTVRKLDLDAREVSTVAGKAPPNPKYFCENISPVIPRECGAADAPNGRDARFRFPFGVAPHDGGFFVVDSHNNLIRRFDFETTAVTTVAGTQGTVLDDLERPSVDTGPDEAGSFSHPSHVLFVAPRTLYVADRSANCIRRVELAH